MLAEEWERPYPTVFPKGANAARNMTKYYLTRSKDSGKRLKFERVIRHLKLTKDTIKLTLRKPKELRKAQSVDRDFASVEG